MKKVLLILFILLFNFYSFAINIGDRTNPAHYTLDYYNGSDYKYVFQREVIIDSKQVNMILKASSENSYLKYSNLQFYNYSPVANTYNPDTNTGYSYYNLTQIYNNLIKDRILLNQMINDKQLNFSSFYGFGDNCENVLYDSNGYAVGYYSENGDCLKPDNEEVFYSNGDKALFSTETDENGNLIYKIITSDTSKALIHSFGEQLKKISENTEIRLFAAVMVVVGGFVAFRLVKRGLNWMKMEPYYSDLDKAYEAYKKGEVGDFTLNKALGRDYKRYKMKNSQWHYGKNGKVIFDNTDGVMSFREFSKNRLKDRYKYKNKYDAKKNEGFKKYVDEKQHIEDLAFKRLPDEELTADEYARKYDKEIKGFIIHHMNNYRSYDETYLRKSYMEEGKYSEETEAEIQNMLNIIEEENRQNDQKFFDKLEEIDKESPIDSMEWHYPISEM